MDPFYVRVILAGIIVLFLVAALTGTWLWKRRRNRQQRARLEAEAVEGEVVADAANTENGGHAPFGAAEPTTGVAHEPTVREAPYVTDVVVTAAVLPADEAGHRGRRRVLKPEVIGRYGPHGEFLGPTELSSVSSNDGGSVHYGEAAYLPHKPSSSSTAASLKESGRGEKPTATVFSSSESGGGEYTPSVGSSGEPKGRKGKGPK